MASGNVIETVWKLLLDKQEAKQGENLIQRLARVVKDSLGRDGAKAVDEVTDALKRQNKQIKENAEDAKKVKLGDAAGDVGGLASKFAGAGSLVGIDTNIVADIADAVEGIAGLGGVITGTLIPALSGAAAALLPLAPILIPLAAVAGAAAIAIGQAVSEIDKHLAQLESEITARRSAVEAAFSGTTLDEAQAQVESFNNSIKAQTFLLGEAQTKRDDAFERDVERYTKQAGVFGFLGDFFARVLGLLGKSDVNKYADDVAESEEKLNDATAGAKEWQRTIDEGLFKTGEAKKEEDSLASARAQVSDTTQQASKSEEKAAREQEKAQAEQQRRVEEAQKQQEQAEEKRYQAAVKYSDSLVDIANKTADGAKQALETQRQGLADNETELRRDLSAIADDFAISEREEALERQEEEANDLRQHGNKLAGIRDEALNTEKDFIRKRDFLSAAQVRERAVSEQEAENRLFVNGQDEKETLRRAEDARELRELADTRLKRRQQLQQQNEDVRLSYQREITAGREARRTMERDAKLNRDREVRDANAQARAYLGIKSQQSQAELSIAQQTLNAIRSMGSTTNNTTVNNNQRSVGNISINGGSMNPAAVRQTMYEVLGEIGVV